MISHAHYALTSHNTFGIAAKCRKFVEYNDVEELKSVIAQLKADNEKHILHIGGGSNLLFTHDYDGMVLHSHILGKQIIKDEGEDVWMRVGAGENWDKFVAYCVSNGYYGLENLSLIPGEVGASAIQNIGAYGAEACQYIDKVEAINLQDGSERTFDVSECRYAYRNSIFKQELRGQYAITHVTYRLSRTFHLNLNYAAVTRELEARHISPNEVTAQQLRDIIIEVRRDKLPDPSEVGSAGSFFMNPIVSKEQSERLLAQWPDMPLYPAGKDVKLAAGWLIQQTGWKGKSLGRAGVWPKQALVLVNLGGATGQDIVNLSDAIRRDVMQKFGIDLHPEANFI